MEKQCTLKNRVSVKGAGLHTRQCGTLTFNPAPINSGIRFRRIDLENQPIIEADVDNVIDTARGTTLGKGGDADLDLDLNNFGDDGYNDDEFDPNSFGIDDEFNG
jgi:UDP-3-O-acyl-N-acetylglucosamine deacetylase